MKIKTVQVVIIFLLIWFVLGAGAIPIHELGHAIAAKCVRGWVNDVCWFSFSSVWPDLGRVTATIPSGGDWIFGLGGGLFQGLIYLILGLVLFAILKIKKNFFESHLILEISLYCGMTFTLFFGIAGIGIGICEAFGIL